MHFFKIPKKFQILFILIIGILAGLGAAIFIIFDMPSYMSKKSEACIKCHVMNSQYSTWNHSSHREYATCADCHLPHDNLLHKYYVKSKDGMKDIALFTMRMEKNVAHSTGDTKDVIMMNCLRCHGQMHEEVNPETKRPETDSQWRGKRCWSCHREVPHGRVRGLASTPDMDIQLNVCPVPDWLNKQLQE